MFCAQGLSHAAQSECHRQHISTQAAIIVEAMAEEWTDGRLDDLSDKVGGGFEKVDQRFEKVDQRFDRIDDKIERGFERVDQRFDREFSRVNERLDSIQRSMVHALIAITGGILAGFSGIMVLIATQL